MNDNRWSTGAALRACVESAFINKEQVLNLLDVSPEEWGKAMGAFVNAIDGENVDTLDTPIEVLCSKYALSCRAYNCFIRNGITTISQLEQAVRDGSYKNFRYMGHKTARDVREALYRYRNNEVLENE